MLKKFKHMLKKFKHHDFATFFSFFNTFPIMDMTFGEKKTC